MNSHRRNRLALALSVLFATSALCAMPKVAQADEDKPLVFIFSGPVRGTVSSAGVREFLGIPYAAPPVGNRRWRPPVAHAPWFAPLEATQFANHCPQPPSPFGRASITEDCLSPQCLHSGLTTFLRASSRDGLDPRRRPHHR